jgi:glutaredoxin
MLKFHSIRSLAKITVACTTLIIALLTSSYSGAEIFTWKDAQGRTHFGDKPPAHLEAKHLELKINTISRPEVTSLDSGFGSQKKVVIYSTEWCGACRKAKSYFKQKSIPYKEYDVEKSAKGRRDYKRLKGKGVPIILVGKQRMNGFSTSRFESIYTP